MNFKQWLDETGMTMFALARICFVSRGTIKNLVEGKTPSIKTVKKLINMTKTLRKPVSYEMFKEIKGKRKKR